LAGFFHTFRIYRQKIYIFFLAVYRILLYNKKSSYIQNYGIYFVKIPPAQTQRKGLVKPMKRCVFLLSLLTLMFCSLHALAQEVISPAVNGKEPRYLTQISNTVYVNTDEDELYALDNSGQPQLKLGGLPDSLLFLSGDDDFLAVDTAAGIVFRFTETESGLTYEQALMLDWSSMADKRYMIEQGIVTGGRICLLAPDDESTSQYSVFFFDLQSGALLPGKIKDAWDICNYETGKILIYMTPLGLDSGISTCDVNTAQTQKLLDAPEGYLSGLAYDRESGTIAITGNGAVYTSKQGAPFTEGGYLNISMQGNIVRAALPDENTYAAIVPNDTVLVCSLSSLKGVKPLHIAGGNLEEETVAAFRRANPGTPVVYMNMMEEDILALQLVLRTGDVDIYVLPTGLPIYGDMLQKGFALDLSGEQQLASTVSAMYPRMKEQVMRDGKLYGLPIYVYTFDALGYNPELFEKAGLAVPQTLFELMDQLESFAQRDDTLLMYASLSGTSEAVLRYISHAYLSATTAKSPEMAFDPETFRSLIARWEAISPGLEKDTAQEMLAESPSMFCSRFLFTPGNGNYLLDEYKVLPLAIGDGYEKILPAVLGAMIVNPASKNQAEAIRFLDFYEENMPWQQRFAMYPDENDPVADPEMLKSVNEKEQDIQLLTDQLAACAPEDQKQLTEQLEQAKKDLASLKADMWVIGADEISAYRDIAGMLLFGREDVGFFTTDKQILDLCNQLSAHKIDSARFCDAFISIWEMAQREE
jgi:hypothetical protein